MRGGRGEERRGEERRREGEGRRGRSGAAVWAQRLEERLACSDRACALAGWPLSQTAHTSDRTHMPTPSLIPTSSLTS
eukprot:2313312-Rhodomonas_salina.1